MHKDLQKCTTKPQMHQALPKMHHSFSEMHQGKRKMHHALLCDATRISHSIKIGILSQRKPCILNGYRVFCCPLTLYYPKIKVRFSTDYIELCGFLSIIDIEMRK